MKSIIGARFTCTGFILLALSGIAKLIVDTSGVYLSDVTRIIPLMTLIGGLVLLVMGVFIIFRRPLFGIK